MVARLFPQQRTPMRGRRSSEEELHANTPLGPAATWSKEFLKKKQEEARRDAELEVAAATGRIDDMLTEFAFALDPASRPPEPPHIPGQGIRGLNHFVAKLGTGQKPAPIPEEDEEAPEPGAEEVAEFKRVKDQLTTLLLEAATRKEERKETLMAVTTRLDAVKEKAKEERKAKLEAERKLRMSARLQAIASGVEEGEDSREARVSRRKAKRRSKAGPSDAPGPSPLPFCLFECWLYFVKSCTRSAWYSQYRAPV